MRFAWVLFALIVGSTCLAHQALAGELDGRWRYGSWTDDNTGHTGPLRARFRETAHGDYRVVFTGRFAKIVPFRFATTLNVVERKDGIVEMAGESRIMGIWRFNYHAVADEHHFQSQYSSSRWRGEFSLQR